MSLLQFRSCHANRSWASNTSFLDSPQRSRKENNSLMNSIISNFLLLYLINPGSSLHLFSRQSVKWEDAWSKEMFNSPLFPSFVTFKEAIEKKSMHEGCYGSRQSLWRGLRCYRIYTDFKFILQIGWCRASYSSDSGNGEWRSGIGTVFVHKAEVIQEHMVG